MFGVANLSSLIVATVDHIGRHPHLHLWSLALELGTAVFSEQPLLARTGHRTLVIGDVPCINLESL